LYGPRATVRVKHLRKTKEKSIERHLMDEVKKTGGRTIKIQGVRGWPDRLVLIRGQLWLVECKRPKGGRYEPLQKRIGAWMLARRYNYVLLKTKEGVDKWIRGR
jgi:hypothetical protein